MSDYQAFIKTLAAPLVVLCLLLGGCLLPQKAGAAWRFQLGPDLPGEFYSVGEYVPSLGLIPTGQYGGGRIAGIDPVTLDYRILGHLPVGRGHESVSAFQLIDGGAGINAWTESDSGAQCWTAWRNQGWVWRLTQSFSPWPWSLAGPSAASRGWMALSEGRPRRDYGSVLMQWAAQGNDRWEPITPTIPGLVVWDAVSWRDGKLLGCSLGNGEYLDEWAGRLVWVRGQEWRLLNLPAMAGVLRIYRFDSWPDRLWVSTTWGEVWYTDNPFSDDWVLWHREDYGKQRNAFVFERAGALAVAGARGGLWHYPRADAAGELVAQVPDTLFMSLSPVDLPDNRWCLAGPLTLRGARNSRTVGFYLK